MTIEQALSIAFKHHQAGQLDAAQGIYQNVLAVAPNHPDALHYMGVICIQRSQNAQAVDWLQKALAAAPSDPGIHRDLGVALFDAGKQAEGLAECELAVQLNPNSAANQNNLGSLLVRSQNRERGLECFLKSLAIDPNHSEGLGNLGSLYQELNRLDEAIDCFRKSLFINPRSAQMHCNLGYALKLKGDDNSAMMEFETAVRLDPRLIKALGFLAEEYLDRKRMRESAELYKQAVAIDPSNFLLLNNLGIALQEQGFWEQAAATYKKALAIVPGKTEILNNLGIAEYRLGLMDQAVEHFTKAIAIKSNDAEVYNNLGNAYKDLSQHEKAIECFRKAITLKSDYAETWSNLLLTQLYMPDFDPARYGEDLDRWIKQMISPIPRRKSHSNDRSPDRKLKIGFVSPDFKEHPVGRFLICLLKKIDRSRHEVFLYHDTPRVDPVTNLIHPLADQWRNTPGLSNPQLDALIQEDRIDILFDLAAHTGNNRLEVFARKPAPVQITWLAYCGTTGLDAIDYRLSDRLMDPPGMFDNQYSEKTIYLPVSYWCYEPPDGVPEPHCPDFPVVFGSLNNFCKMNIPLIDAFAQILSRVPGSSILLHAQEGSHRENARRRFADHGVDPARIRFVRRTQVIEYFAAYNQIHIALDPFPFNGGTTTCDAIWMGLPVISRVCSDRAMGRAGKTLLENLQLTEFLADTTEKYISIAVDLAADPEKILSLRRSLRERMRNSPLMDSAAFAADFASILRSLWIDWLNHDPR